MTREAPLIIGEWESWFDCAACDTETIGLFIEWRDFGLHSVTRECTKCFDILEIPDEAL